ncbi:MAG: MgtC/SapB family protein [Spirochaetaceae bacterium]|nr:MAG: MgtC/SapB family protein [Spirochaetaceae bacterium]
MIGYLDLFPEAVTSSFVIRLAVACFLGAVIGFERDIHGRAAGLRTNMLVSMGAALFMLISAAVAESYSGGPESTGLRVDPSRIAAQIVTGIGFLGAGAIIKEGFNIRGLTTAACLWVSAGVGMAAGAGLFEMAILVTLIGVFTLVVVNRFEKIYAKDSYRVLEITVPNDADISRLINVVKRRHLKILFLDFDRNYQTNLMVITFTIRLFHRGVTDKLSHAIVKDVESCGYTMNKLKWGH